MSFQVTFYTISKKVNSTRLPSDGGTSYECLAKEDIDIMKPVISLRLAVGNAPETRNYAYIPSFNRYYFVDSWTYSNGLWNAELSVDVMGTYKSQIGSSSVYVLRSSSEYDLEMVDNYYPIESGTSIVRDTIDSPWDINNGMYIVTILGNGLSNHYLIHISEFDGLIRYLFSDAYLDQLFPMWHDLMPDLKTKVNPLQYISSVRWIPFRVTLNSGIVADIDVGYGTAPCTAQIVPDNSVRVIEKTFTLRKHPQESRGKYLNKAPYTTYNLFYPPYGLIELDSNVIGSSTKLTMRVEVDLRVGKSTLSLAVDNDFNAFKVISWMNSDISVEVQLSQITRSGPSIGSVLKPIMQLVSGNIGGSIMSSVGNIGDGTRAMTPTVSSYGSDGAKNTFGNSITLMYGFKNIGGEDLANVGRPLCKVKTISSLSGYVLCSNAHISISGATKNEQDLINQYMEGGFYYE